ncbi:hypothetical protein [Streptomyces lunaelactis]|uniref:hypothetical protein n=1 Tax=Streptomyces lunaelactis TaxID=1535768 RepID=UPI0020C74954|nr:hypothetical protein [Streptomyces lunaelactis]
MAHTAFPSDLVEAQRDWNRTYAELADGQVPYTALRRRLLWLSCCLAVHPFWGTELGRSPAARVELRERVRSQEEGESHGRSPHGAAGEHPAVHHGVDR